MIKVGDKVKHSNKGDTIMTVVASFDDWVGVRWNDDKGIHAATYTPHELIKIRQIKSSRS